MPLSAEQLRILNIVERCASILSILGIATIICIFCFSRKFRNPIHRIVFINAFYNLFDVVATTIALSGPAAGNHSALCQFQGFLNQMFPLADVLWTLVMAVDIFLIVFFKFEAQDLRRLEWKYFTGITTLVFVPALTFLFIHTPERGPMYASQTIWCSVSPHWVLYRIVFFYGPIWLSISVVIVLYSLVGIEVLKRTRETSSIGSEDISLDAAVSPRYGTSTTSTSSSRPLTTPPSDSIQSQLVSVSEFQDSKETSSPSNPIRPPTLNRFDTMTAPPVTHQRVSFRQYILLPVMFFLVLLAVWVAPTTNRVSAFVHPGYESYPLLLAVVSTGSLRGFWNAVVFIALGMKERRRARRLRSEGRA